MSGEFMALNFLVAAFVVNAVHCWFVGWHARKGDRFLAQEVDFLRARVRALERDNERRRLKV